MSNLSVSQKTSAHLSITALAVLKQKSMGGISRCQVVLKDWGRRLILVIRTMLLHPSKKCYWCMIQLLWILSGCSWGIEIGLYIFFIWWFNPSVFSFCATFFVFRVSSCFLFKWSTTLNWISNFFLN